MPSTKTQPLIRIENLKKYFYSGGNIIASKRKTLKAVDDVTFEIYKGETFGLVGESGCGKSTLARSIARMYTVTGGHVYYDNREITRLKRAELKPYNKKMQFIFQDPYSALNPYFNVKDILLEPMRIHLNLTKNEMLKKAEALLERVGLHSSDISKHPNEFSGGQRQRIGIARALSVDPEFILCDEPISALDVSIQAQVVNALIDIQAERNLTYLFVAHDLSMVKHISDRIGVMYLGRLVEIAPGAELYKNPIHPYTQALLNSIPIPDPKRAKQTHAQRLSGEVPSPFNIPTGCSFRPRCPISTPVCAEQVPRLQSVNEMHIAACHNAR